MSGVQLKRFDRRAAWQEDYVPNLRMMMVMALAIVMVMVMTLVMVMLVVVVVTEVLGKETMCLTIIATATLSSRRANLIPRQALGPWPKAWKAWGDLEKNKSFVAIVELITTGRFYNWSGNILFICI